MGVVGGSSMLGGCNLAVRRLNFVKNLGIMRLLKIRAVRDAGDVGKNNNIREKSMRLELEGLRCDEGHAE